MSYINDMDYEPTEINLTEIAVAIIAAIFFQMEDYQTVEQAVAAARHVYRESAKQIKQQGI